MLRPLRSFPSTCGHSSAACVDITPTATYVCLSCSIAGLQGMHGADMYGVPPVTSNYSAMQQIRPPVHSQAMLIPGHPHHTMMMAHGGPMGHPGMPLQSAQSPPLHGGMDMGHIQDIHAG